MIPRVQKGGPVGVVLENLARELGNMYLADPTQCAIYFSSLFCMRLDIFKKQNKKHSRINRTFDRSSSKLDRPLHVGKKTLCTVHGMHVVSTIYFTSQKTYHLGGDEDGKYALLCMHPAHSCEKKKQIDISHPQEGMTTSLRGRASPHLHSASLVHIQRVYVKRL
jgi:hypothetical protein